VPKTSSTSCDQAVFVDQATGVSLPSDAVPVEIDRFGEGFQRRGCVQGAVRPVLIVELAPTSADPAFDDRVHARRPDIAQHGPDIAQHGPDTGIGKDRVECGGEVRAAIADHELDPGAAVRRGP